MADKGEPIQRCKPPRAEHDSHQSRCRRHRRQPGQSRDDAEGDRRECRDRERDEGDDRQRPGEIDRRENVALRKPVLQPSNAQRADDVEQPDRGDHPAAGLHGHAAVGQIGRQMHGDESELKAAGEETEHQQHVGTMAERLRKRRPERLLVRHGGRIRRCRGWRCERKRQRYDQQHQKCEYRQCRLPAEIVDQGDAERREQKLPERSRGGSRAKRNSAPLGRQQLAERGQHQVERTPRQSETDQDPGADIERQRRRRVAHHQQTGGV